MVENQLNKTDIFFLSSFEGKKPQLNKKTLTETRNKE